MLVGFNGLKSSGKDTAGTRLAAMVEQDAFRLSFARQLKESAAALFDIPVEDWETYKNDPTVQIHLAVGWRDSGFTDKVFDGEELQEPNVIRTFTAREFLQRYGTESHRAIFGDNFWIDQALDNRIAFGSPSSLYYVTDCRFVNEARAIRDRYGVIVRVIGPEDESADTHVSEAPLPDEYITFEIDNTIRDDGFVNLDRQLIGIASLLGLTPTRSIA